MRFLAALQRICVSSILPDIRRGMRGVKLLAVTMNDDSRGGEMPPLIVLIRQHTLSAALSLRERCLRAH